jgi:putative ABC transport system permease protein
MSEFGTLRAIGYNRLRVFFIIFCEVFLLALFALTCAFIGSAAILLLASRTGIHVGSGAASYLFGGEYLYPLFKLQDALIAFTVILILSLIAPYKPAMKLSLQKVSDILRKRQDRSPLAIMLLRSLLRRAGSS